VSKRSYRRLAAVTGAALALGSMAPAMAARVSATGTADAGVEVTDVTLPSIDTSAATGLLSDLSSLALGTVQATQQFAVSTAGSLQGQVDDIVGDLLGGSLLSVDANATINVSGGSLSATGLLDADSNILGVVPSPDALVGTAFGLAGQVQTIANPIVNTALGLPATAIGLVAGAPDIVFGLVDSLSLTAGGDANVGASLLGMF
jgi:hypothetical protein